jgi:uncharacterized membrane protein
MDKLLGLMLSKTFWMQIIGMAAMAMAMFGIEFPAEDQATIATGVMAVVAAVNVVLRLVTKESVENKVQ